MTPEAEKFWERVEARFRETYKAEVETQGENADLPEIILLEVIEAELYRLLERTVENLLFHLEIDGGVAVDLRYIRGLRIKGDLQIRRGLPERAWPILRKADFKSEVEPQPQTRPEIGALNQEGMLGDTSR